MNKTLFWIGDAEITLRELLLSFVILAIMVCSGFVISNKINEAHNNKVYDYQTALQIEDSDTLSYAVKTNIGKILAYGDIKAVDPVTFDELGNDTLYSHASKVEEHYTMHTRTVTHTDSNGHTYTTTEIYYTWDRYEEWNVCCSKVEFIGNTFNYNKIPFGYEEYITTDNFAPNKRYVYYGAPIESEGTLFAKVADNDLIETNFHEGKNIDETLENINKNIWGILFWIVWIILICGIEYGFFYLDNDWLNNKRR